MRSTIIFLAALFCIANAAKILVVFPAMAHSHFTIGSSLVKGLASRGHEITFVTPFEEKEPVKNVKSVFLSKVNKLGKERQSVNMFEMFSVRPLFMLFALPSMGLLLSEGTLTDPALQSILNSNETYDAVISECFVSDSLQGIAYRLKAPSILATTLGPSVWTNYINGAPSVYSYMAHPFLGYGQRMTFWERLENVIMITSQNLVNYLYHLPQQNKLLHKYIPEAPSVYELIQNTSLHLFNSDPAYNGPLPILPNMVEIGGLHIQAPKKLPDDLQKYLDDSKDGVIYFSMGGNLKSKDLPQKVRDSMLRVFSQLKENVLWKFEEDLPDKSPNVEIRSWLPQRDVLAHPNIKLFITHGGLLGTSESLASGVPFIGIPVFGDQALNMKVAGNGGYGISVPYKDFTEEKLSSAINEMLRNSTYSRKAKELAVLIKDKQVTQLDKAIFSIEYVIRHKGAHHLKSAAHDLAWYQYYSIDVILFLILVVIVSLKVFCVLIRKLFCKKKEEKQKRH